MNALFCKYWLSAVVASLVSISNAWAGENYDVYPVPGQPVLQGAINAAPSGVSVTVRAAPGVYNEKIDFNGKAVTLKGALGPSGERLSIIDATGLGDSAVTFDSGETYESAIENFVIQGGSGHYRTGRRYGAGIYIESSSPAIRNCKLTMNSAHTGGGVYAFASDCTIDRCEFDSNIASQGGDGGGGVYQMFGDVSITNCRFTWNYTSEYGGALRFVGAEGDVVNCIFLWNYGFYGGAMNNSGSEIRALNCTIASNSAFSQSQDTGGAAMVGLGGSTQFRNSILWNNSPNQITTLDPSTSSVDYCSVSGGWATGIGNTSDDPGFENLVNGDVQLQPNSPLIDFGSNADVAGYSHDILGQNRIVCNVDLGAYEFQTAGPGCCPTDLTGDGVVNVSDLFALLSHFGEQMPGADLAPPNNTIDVSDLFVLLAAWGACP